MPNNKNCRICGYPCVAPPWGEDGNTPLFEHCPCCGAEFGYQDSTVMGIRKFRENWIKNGAQWDDSTKRPAGWNLEKHLKNIPEEYH
jgi:hypothetical protein